MDFRAKLEFHVFRGSAEAEIARLNQSDCAPNRSTGWLVVPRVRGVLLWSLCVNLAPIFLARWNFRFPIFSDFQSETDIFRFYVFC